MTRNDAIARKAALEKRRDELIDQLSQVDVASMTISGGGGSKSLTNRSVADIKAKIAAVDREIGRLAYMLGTSSALPGQPNTVKIGFDAP